ncbi:hypothetical protein C8F01DRAFT_1250439 [Mycena amicta]|nr:hypothetical protein C8F01DRAFT_1250439 [Mycena amicta]
MSASRSSAEPTLDAEPTPDAPISTLPTTESRQCKGKSRATMSKSERLQKNGKNWAQGAREDLILRPRWDEFMAAKLVGGLTLKSFFTTVQNEFIFKIGWQLADDLEPDLPLPEYDPTAPPIVEMLSEDEETKKEKRIHFLCGRVKRWFLNRLETANKPKKTQNRSRPVRTAQLAKVEDVEDAVVYVANRLGLPPPKRASAGYQLYMTECFATEIAPVVAQRWAERPERAHKPIDALPPPELGTKIALELFNKLDPERQEDLTTRAKTIAKQNKEEYEAQLKAWPPTTPEDRQMAQNLIKPLMKHLLEAVADATGMHLFLVLGGPVPMWGGDIRTIHLSVGANHAPVPVPFSQWDAAHWDREVIDKFKVYLETAYTPAERLASAIKKKTPIVDNPSLLRLDHDNEPITSSSKTKTNNSRANLNSSAGGSSANNDGMDNDNDSENSGGEEESDNEGEDSEDSTERRRQYERGRQESIRKTQQIMRDMGLLDATKNLFSEKPAKERGTCKEKPLPTGPPRRSRRGKPGQDMDAMDVSEGDEASSSSAGGERIAGTTTDEEAGSVGTEPDGSESESDGNGMVLSEDELVPPPVIDTFSSASPSKSAETTLEAESSSTTKTPEEQALAKPKPTTSSKPARSGGLGRLLAIDAAKQETQIPPCPTERTKKTAWLCDVYPELTTVNLGGAFNNTLAAFFALKAAYGFANGSGRVSAEGRPIQLHYWIQHKRVPKPDLCAIKDTAAFSKEYWGWWTGIQPSWREGNEGGPAR